MMRAISRLPAGRVDGLLAIGAVSTARVHYQAGFKYADVIKMWRSDRNLCTTALLCSVSWSCHFFEYIARIFGVPMSQSRTLGKALLDTRKVGMWPTNAAELQVHTLHSPLETPRRLLILEVCVPQARVWILPVSDLFYRSGTRC